MNLKKKCFRCGKDISIKRIAQFRLRRADNGYAWESSWRGLCPECTDQFEAWLLCEKKSEEKENGNGLQSK